MPVPVWNLQQPGGLPQHVHPLHITPGPVCWWILQDPSEPSVPTAGVDLRPGAYCAPEKCTNLMTPSDFSLTIFLDQGCAECTKQSDCPAKRVAVGQCLGSGTSNAVSCVTCPTSGCVNGTSFVSNNCALDGYSTCATCRRSCAANQYISSPCTLEDDTQCTECAQTCASGAYMNRTCTGIETRDASLCLSCTSIESCPTRGQFVNLSACSSPGQRLLTREKICTNCTACKPGVEWEQSPCTLFSDRVCKPCTVCQSLDDVGTYQVRAICN